MSSILAMMNVNKLVTHSHTHTDTRTHTHRHAAESAAPGQLKELSMYVTMFILKIQCLVSHANSFTLTVRTRHKAEKDLWLKTFY